MQVVRFDKKQDSEVIHIDDVVESWTNVYCCHRNEGFRFLIFKNERYHWSDLEMNCNSFIEFKTFKEALSCFTGIFKVLIFESQSELREYIKSM